VFERCLFGGGYFVLFFVWCEGFHYFFDEVQDCVEYGAEWPEAAGHFAQAVDVFGVECFCEYCGCEVGWCKDDYADD